MPIITIQAIQGVVLTSPQQKAELLKKMTDTFISDVVEAARPYTSILIQETTTTAIDLDGDGTFDAVEEIVATGVDLDGDGTIDEIEVTETVYGTDELEAGDDAEGDEG